jgi:hypothetical protein
MIKVKRDSLAKLFCGAIFGIRNKKT